LRVRGRYGGCEDELVITRRSLLLGGGGAVGILHGTSGSAAAFRDFGFARFLTTAVEQGAPPFVLAGTDDGPEGWVSDGTADPQTMVLDEMPGWLSERGFDADRRALWGWSRGGLDALAALPLGLWCGAEDPFVDAVRELVAALPVEPEVLTFAEGGHTRLFWNDHTLDAFSWLAGKL